MSNPGWVYLLHFEKPFKGTSHYIGWTSDFKKRMECHKKKKGARILRALVIAGIKFHCVRVWMENGHFEQRLKKQRNHKRYCPICSDLRGKKVGFQKR